MGKVWKHDLYQMLEHLKDAPPPPLLKMLPPPPLPTCLVPKMPLNKFMTSPDLQGVVGPQRCEQSECKDIFALGVCTAIGINKP